MFQGTNPNRFVIFSIFASGVGFMFIGVLISEFKIEQPNLLIFGILGISLGVVFAIISVKAARNQARRDSEGARGSIR